MLKLKRKIMIRRQVVKLFFKNMLETFEKGIKMAGFSETAWTGYAEWTFRFSSMSWADREYRVSRNAVKNPPGWRLILADRSPQSP